MPVVKETEYYDLLQVATDATQKQIESSFRALSKSCHPDLHPNDPVALERFKALTEAKTVLTDQRKREVYDKYGKEGLQNGYHEYENRSRAGGFADAFPFFRRSPGNKGEDIIHQILVNLEDLYKGKTRKLAVTRNIVCSLCKGSGAKKNKRATTCTSCRGFGVKIVSVGPAMVQQIICSDCRGKKEIIKEEDKCEGCKGNKVVESKKTLEVHIERGMRDGEKIKFTGEADQSPGLEPGDIIFVVKQKEHPHFKRVGADLYYEHKISLMDALGGTSFNIKHLDDRVLLVNTEEGDIITPGSMRVLPNEGMPIHKRPQEKGHLFIKFDVEFPAPHSLKPAQLQALASLLPPRNEPPRYNRNAENVEEVTLSAVANEHIRPDEDRYEAYEDDDRREEGVHQCSQQ